MGMRQQPASFPRSPTESGIGLHTELTCQREAPRGAAPGRQSEGSPSMTWLWGPRTDAPHSATGTRWPLLTTGSEPCGSRGYGLRASQGHVTGRAAGQLAPDSCSGPAAWLPGPPAPLGAATWALALATRLLAPSCLDILGNGERREPPHRLGQKADEKRSRGGQYNLLNLRRFLPQGSRQAAGGMRQSRPLQSPQDLWTGWGRVRGTRARSDSWVSRRGAMRKTRKRSMLGPHHDGVVFPNGP